MRSWTICFAAVVSLLFTGEFKMLLAAEASEPLVLTVTTVALDGKARNEFAAKELSKCVKEYAKAADAMSKVANLFPFPGEGEKIVDDEKIIDEAADLLKSARDSEVKAMKHLAKVAVLDWPKG